MKKKTHMNSTILLGVAIFLSSVIAGCSGSGAKSDEATEEEFNVEIGVITYSWRDMPSTPEDIINYCKQTGITSIELMSDAVEAWAGAPEAPGFPENFREMTDEEREAFRAEREAHQAAVSEWRVNDASPEMYTELKEMFDDAGISIHIVKFSPANWSDAEIDYAFESAKVLGADGVSNEIDSAACVRLGKFAEKHDMYAIFHNHGQPGDSTFNFEDFLAYSPRVMLNFDAGHYFGATGQHPNELIEKLHERIYSIHLKDKTGKDADPPDTNMPWGEGDTPIADILNLIKDNQWDIHCDIELEYPIPEGSTSVAEVGKCVDYCNKILEGEGEGEEV